MTQATLAKDLMGHAICNTDHPAAAACALILAAGQVLHAKFGAAGAISMMRAVIDDTEATIVAMHGQRPGEAMQ